MNVALRTGHILAFATLVGGHVFGVDRQRLLPALAATVATGAALMALELARTCEWLFMLKGVATLAKLCLVLLVPLFWGHRVAILVLATIVASGGAHMPARFRNYSLRSGPLVESARPAGRHPGKRQD